MHQKVDDDIQHLTSTVQDKLLMNIDEYRDWSTEFSAKVSEARRVYNESAAIINEPYNSEITQPELTPIIEHCQSVQKEIETFMSDTPPVVKLGLKYDIHDLPSIEASVSIDAHRTENGRYLIINTWQISPK
jgi:hypothetical protein